MDEQDKRVFHRYENPIGRRWEEWVELWWQWCYSFPYNESPPRYYTEKFSLFERFQGKIWFLAGTYGGKAQRTCTISSKTSIFFPIINDIISFHTDPQLRTDAELIQYAKNDLDHIRLISANLDGINISNLKSFRVLSNLFSVKIPQEGNDMIWRESTAVSDGFWLFVKPLSPGNHILKFQGEKLEFDRIKNFKNLSDEELDKTPKFSVDVTYIMQVV